MAAFASSYIPTTTTALTRSADVASVNTLSPWFNSASGTIYAESQKIANETATLFPRVVIIDDNTLSNALGATWATAPSRLRNEHVSGGVGQSNLGTSGLTQTAINKIAFGYASADYAVSVNGGAVSTQLSGVTPSGLTGLRLGHATAGSQLNGWLRRVTFYPRKLSNAELITLTT